MTLSARAQRFTFTTLAGPATGAGSVDGTGAAARFANPGGIAVDGGGNVYVADTDNQTIRRITPAGVVTTFAGLADHFAAADGPGGFARFNRPLGMAADSGGTLYVADTFNHTIRKISPAGVVTTLAGSPGLPGSADGVGSAARFNLPADVAVDGGGNAYVVEMGTHIVRKITPAAAVTTLAGSAGLVGSADGVGSAARFSRPIGVAVDSLGNVYVADSLNHAIRKVSPAGAVVTLAGSPIQGSLDGTGSAARFRFPKSVAVDGGGNVYVSDSENGTIRKISPAAVVTTLAGTASTGGLVDGTGGAARFLTPGDLAIDAAGNLFVADTRNHAIRTITPAGVVTTLAGSASPFDAIDATGSAARFSSPSQVAADSGGNIYVCDSSNRTVRKVTPAGVVTTFAGSAGLGGSADGIGSAARFLSPWAIATDAGGNLYVADVQADTIRRITPAGAVTTLAGLSGTFGSVDGTGSAVRFNRPQGVSIDGSGNVYVGDTTNHTVRKITPAGIVTTLAGSPGLSGSADGTGSAARFNQPTGVAADGGGNVYVSDSNNNTIRKITPAGIVTTFAGAAGLSGSTDGIGSAARFFRPQGMSIDGGGNLYVAEQGNNTVRKITPAGVVTTLGGAGVNIFGSTDGTGSVARFSAPFGVTVDSGGSIYVADYENNRIRIGVPALADDATIDAATGPAGVTRQLDTSPQTATSWQWLLTRRPTGSSAALSSTTIRNPLFTPDLADVYVFRLTASDGTRTSITTVTLTAPLNQPPVAHVQNVTVNGGASCTASASIDDGSFDPDGGAVTLAQSPPGPYPLGTTSVQLTVTDNQGATAQASANVTVADATAPSLTLPAPITQDFVSEAGAVVTYSTTTSDNCPGTIAVSCLAASGSTFPIGPTTVTCTATDPAGNSTTGSFTVTVLGARGVWTSVLAGLTALRASVTDKRVATALDRAIGDLQASLDPANWVDQTHLDPVNGDLAFQGAKNAVNQLTNLKMPSLQTFIDQIVNADRLLATVAIVEAGNPPTAVALRASGDQDVAGARYESGIEQYRNAWADALKGH